MKKMAVVSIGYRDYAMSMTDATTLMAIAQRAKIVEQTGFTGPYRPVDSDDDAAFASRMEIALVQGKKPVIPKSHRLTYDGK
ncbi:hypothetical protein JUN65_01960 [Gluconacetobacter azotocaptans]|uniref:hypothetical protein n=1 Tax=Gluconacetobacter azotocaptans TaxID=142834 RepID=UPI00195E43FB|nr:hypothetical protein [Gluconacetobacter azotocaptans]MBM9400358.1 hypothetical protein [Gluconacetobacter azotocaptans]